ncbi:type VI secretion system baseplate subunit TssK [Aquisalimonas sp. 2447]|uniref:type VI secretion system baseplate subunit TssK n=1 Tax=Aquisalimonas sp. 2447 TaxID=2740807 RepID=UPI00143237F9|nr:type VI secretion system baseplate subunit TssK [Aquisalimonas sp. 2447]QIT55814.1 type VI secretion system baseplate subunit TssK [Aquisalimonas sp. 2447]
MSEHKTLWLESQYLFPQHFQQQERHFEERLESRAAAIRPHVRGFHELTLDEGALAEGRLSLSAARGIMPDGTPFTIPDGARAPSPLQVGEASRGERIYLALPNYQHGVRFVDTTDAGGPDRVARYRLRMTDVFDYAADGGQAEPVETGALNFSLLYEHEELGGYSVLPVARVREVTPEGALILDPEFVPPVLDINASRMLRDGVDGVLGSLHQRGEALALRFNESGKAGGTSAIADFLLLQLTNRYELRLRHLCELALVHPERLYTEFAGLAGELATFTTEERRPARLPRYNHDDLYGCFSVLHDVLGRALSTVLEQTALSLPVEERQYGIRVARLPDRELLKSARFVVAARAEMPTDTLRRQLEVAMKVGTVETIRDLVNNHLPGIGITALPMAPREIPYHAGSVYFELDSHSDHWQQLENSAGFALHVADEMPGLKLDMWAIRD